MGCCECEKYHLANEKREVVYTNGRSGKEYCWLHAPVGKKGMDDDTFSRHVESMIEVVFHEEPGHDGAIPYADFSGAIFPWDIKIWPYDTDGHLPCCDFQNAVFLGNVDLSGTHCPSLKFSGTRFVKDFLISKATINNSEFKQAEFEGNADFQFSTFVDTPQFRKAHFHREADFNNCNFEKGAGFQYCEFDGKANFFRCCAPNGKIHLQLVDVGNLSFSCRETPLFLFQTCDWPKKLLPEVTDNFNPKASEDLYRSLKLVAISEYNMPMVSRWHYNEKRMALKRIPNRRKFFSVTWWYCMSSGFGEKPVRAFVVLFALVLFPLLLLAAHKLYETGISSSVDIVAVNDVFRGWLMCMPLTKISASYDNHGAGTMWFFWLSQIIISIQAALFAFALRNRFRR